MGPGVLVSHPLWGDSDPEGPHVPPGGPGATPTPLSSSSTPAGSEVAHHHWMEHKRWARRAEEASWDAGLAACPGPGSSMASREAVNNPEPAHGDGAPRGAPTTQCQPRQPPQLQLLPTSRELGGRQLCRCPASQDVLSVKTHSGIGHVMGPRQSPRVTVVLTQQPHARGGQGKELDTGAAPQGDACSGCPVD